MNLSAIQFVQPIDPARGAVRVVAARVARISLLYLAIACSGALGAALLTLVARFGFLTVAGGVALGLLPIALSMVTIRVGTQTIRLFTLYSMHWLLEFKMTARATEERLHHSHRFWRFYYFAVTPFAYVFVLYGAWTILRECAFEFRVGVMIGLAISTAVLTALHVLRHIHAIQHEKDAERLFHEDE